MQFGVYVSGFFSEGPAASFFTKTFFRTKQGWNVFLLIVGTYLLKCMLSNSEKLHLSL